MEEGGALWLLGRIKDMLLVDGANVYPGAIEDVVGAHPGIADVCAVGMPDEEDGERVRLFVVRRDPALDEAAVAAWCMERLSHFKQPKRIEFLDALPRSAVDKVLRRELAERPLD
jgi:long-chain acyl-CoA synthetase